MKSGDDFATTFRRDAPAGISVRSSTGIKRSCRRGRTGIGWNIPVKDAALSLWDVLGVLHTFVFAMAKVVPLELAV